MPTIATSSADETRLIVNNAGVSIRRLPSSTFKDKVLLYSDINSVQFKQAGLITPGFISFLLNDISQNTQSTIDKLLHGFVWNENTVEFTIWNKASFAKAYEEIEEKKKINSYTQEDVDMLSKMPAPISRLFLLVTVVTVIFVVAVAVILIYLQVVNK